MAKKEERTWILLQIRLQAYPDESLLRASPGFGVGAVLHLEGICGFKAQPVRGPASLFIPNQGPCFFKFQTRGRSFRSLPTRGPLFFQETPRPIFDRHLLTAITLSRARAPKFRRPRDAGLVPNIATGCFAFEFPALDQPSHSSRG